MRSVINALIFLLLPLNAFATATTTKTTAGQVFSSAITANAALTPGTQGNPNKLKSHDPHTTAVEIQGEDYTPAGAAPSLINPTHLSAWLHAGTGYFQTASSACSGTAASANGDPVGCWQDQSGNANNFFTSGSNSTRPLLTTNSLNGKSGLTFDGVNDWLGAVDATNLRFASGSIFIVYDVLSQTNTNQSLISKIDNTGGYGVFFNTGSGTPLSLKTYSGSLTTSTTSAFNTAHLMTAIGTIGGQTDIYDNGTSGFSGAGGGLWITSNDDGVTSIGCRAVSAASPPAVDSCSNIIIYDVAIYNTNLNSSDRGNVNAYYATQFGLTVSGATVVQIADLLQVKNTAGATMLVIDKSGLLSPPQSTTVNLPTACNAGAHVWNTSVNADCVCGGNSWVRAANPNAGCL